MDCCGLNGTTIMDHITGRELADCDDEQIRQGVERLLIEKKGYMPSDIEVDRVFHLDMDGAVEQGRAELVVYVNEKPYMTIKNSRGSLVSREREALSASRLACETVVPFTVVTNGRDAELLDTATGQILATGLEAIPDKDEARKGISGLIFSRLDPKKREREGRVYLAFAGFQCPTSCH